MTVARIGDWLTREPSHPTGATINIGAGTDRLFVLVVLSQFEGGYDWTSLTIGGESYDYAFQSELDKTASIEDTQVTYFVWTEATIAAMPGTFLAYTGDEAPASPTGIFFTYATFGDCSQVLAPQAYAATSQSSDTLEVETPSSADDYIVMGVSRSVVGRDVTDWDSLTEIFDAGGEGFRQALADGQGGDATTTLTGDGTAGDFNALALILPAATTDIDYTLDGAEIGADAGTVVATGNSDAEAILTGAAIEAEGEHLEGYNVTLYLEGVALSLGAGTFSIPEEIGDVQPSGGYGAGNSKDSDEQRRKMIERRLKRHYERLRRKQRWHF